MKVLFLNQIPEVNNKYTYSLARSLKKSGINIEVCGIQDDNVEQYTDVPQVSIFESYSKKNNLFSKILSYRKSWRKVFGFCLKNEIDLVHVQWYIFSPLDYYYHQKLRKKGIKVVTTIHDLLPFNRKFYDLYFHKKIYSHASVVINQARLNKEKLINEFGVNEENIVYIPHGHYMEYAEKMDVALSRKKLNIPQNIPVILFFGQIKKVKGVDVLIESINYVRQKQPNVLCVIAGKVWKDDFSIYQALIEELDLEKNIRTDIRFIKDEEVKYYFNAADIVALPYTQIYQSGVVLLAFAYEKPVVATREGEFLTVIKDKETGLLINAGDPLELASALNWYIENPDKATEYARNGYKDINDRLSWDTISKSVKEVYCRALQM